jgi:pimeloyl-ACP methyl ester carboxylesterase
MSELLAICGTRDPDRCGDIVFVHGLNGDARSTWQPEGQPERFWPAWLCEDVPGVGVWSVGYPISSFGWKGSTMALADRAVNILDLLTTEGVGQQKPVIFITHSLGGLLVKEMLRKATDGSVKESKVLAEHTRGVVFLSTPHSGSNLANFVDYLKFLLPTVSVDELQTQEPRLRELNTWYRNNVEKLGIATQVYCERKPTPSGKNFWGQLVSTVVVDAVSSDPGIAGVTAVPMDDDHISISRPLRNRQLYKGVTQFIFRCLEINPASAHSSDSNADMREEDAFESESSTLKRLLLKEYRSHWIEPYLNKILCYESLIEIKLVQNHALEGFSYTPNPSPNFTIDITKSMSDLIIFVRHESNKLLLIEGESGMGKTTLLLRVGETFVEEAEQSSRSWIPIYLHFDLAVRLEILDTMQSRKQDEEWKIEKDYDRWLRVVQELYKLNKQKVEVLLRDNKVLFLLDGFDEIPLQYRAVYAASLNDFIGDYKNSLVIVSSQGEALRSVPNGHWPHFDRAFSLIPLGRETVQSFFDNLRNVPEKNKRAVLSSPYFMELANTPLMLSVLGELSEQTDLLNFSGNTSTVNHKSFIWDKFIERLLERDRAPKMRSLTSIDANNKPILDGNDRKQLLTRLSWLASKMEESGINTFYIENIQPSWLPLKYKYYYAITTTLVVQILLIPVIVAYGFRLLEIMLSIAMTMILAISICFGIWLNCGDAAPRQIAQHIKEFKLGPVKMGEKLHSWLEDLARKSQLEVVPIVDVGWDFCLAGKLIAKEGTQTLSQTSIFAMGCFAVAILGSRGNLQVATIATFLGSAFYLLTTSILRICIGGIIVNPNNDDTASLVKTGFSKTFYVVGKMVLIGVVCAILIYASAWGVLEVARLFLRGPLSQRVIDTSPIVTIALSLAFFISFPAFIGASSYTKHLILRSLLDMSDLLPFNYSKMMMQATRKGIMHEFGKGYRFYHGELQSHLGGTEFNCKASK